MYLRASTFPAYSVASGTARALGLPPPSEPKDTFMEEIMLASYKKLQGALFGMAFYVAIGGSAFAQSAGNSTSVIGTVADPSGAVVPNASVEIRNPVSRFERTATTDDAGRFAIPNVPFNPYHLTARSQGFATYAQDIDVRSVVPVSVSVNL